MWMWTWVVQNKQWVFSGGGIAAFGVLWWIIKKFLPKPEQATAIAPVTAQASIAPSIVMSPTVNFPVAATSPAPEVSKVITSVPAGPKPKPNLCVEAIKTGKIYLAGDIWTLQH